MKKWIGALICLSAAVVVLVVSNAFKTPKYFTRYNTMLACDYYLLNQTNPAAFARKLFQNWRGLKEKDLLHKVLTNLPRLRQKMKDGAIVYVSSNDLAEYCDELLLKGDKKVILVIKGDPTFPDEYSFCDRVEEIVSSDNLLHMFVPNNNYQGSSTKVSSLPVGINHPKEYKFPHSPRKFDREVDKILATLKPIDERNIRPLCDFQFANSRAWRLNKMGEDRSLIAETLKETGLCDFLDKRIPQLELYRLKAERAFDISPAGNGIDCYRTWESLMLGCIVIVKTSFLDPMFEGLPVVTVKDWSEVTEENLRIWLVEYGDVTRDENVRKKVSHAYWMSQIRSVQCNFRIASNS